MEPIKFVCKKVSYSSEDFANQDIKRFKFIDDGRRKPIRSYLCNKCNTWHITSRINLEATILSLTIENESLRTTVTDLQTKIKDLQWFKKWSELNKKYHLLLKKINPKHRIRS